MPHSQLDLSNKQMSGQRILKYQKSKKQVVPPVGGGNLNKPSNTSLNISVDIKNKRILNKDIANQFTVSEAPTKSQTRHVRAAT